MAVVIVKAGSIANRDAAPRVKNNASAENGRLKSAAGAVVVTNGDSVGSTYILASVPSNARVSSLRIFSDDLGTTTAGNVGLYRTTDDGSAAVSASLFASALNLNSGALSAVEIAHQSGTFSIAKIDQPLWKVLGLSSDPSIMYDIVLTLSGACDGTGNVGMVADFVS